MFPNVPPRVARVTLAIARSIQVQQENANALGGKTRGDNRREPPRIDSFLTEGRNVDQIRTSIAVGHGRMIGHKKPPGDALDERHNPSGEGRLYRHFTAP